MPTIKIDQFAGIAPRIHPTLLPDAMAQTAHNCVLKSGKLVPLRQPATSTFKNIIMSPGMHSMSEASSMHVWRHGSETDVLGWAGRVSVAHGNFYPDPLFRFFISGETGIGEGGAEPGVVFSKNGIRAVASIVKSKLPAPVAVRESSASLEGNDNIRYTAFFQTWVDEFGYESPASMPSSEVQYLDEDTIRFEAVAAPEGAAKRRLYKAVASSNGGSPRFLLEQTVDGNAFPQTTSSLSDDLLGEEMPGIESAPADLEGLCFVPGGFYAGWRRSNAREVRFSEVGAPISWPERYGYAVDHNIVGLAATNNSLFVITDGYPYVITGTSQDTMVVSRIASMQGCVSPKSICVLDGAVYYSSADGLCSLRDSAEVATVITGEHYSKREWQNLEPESCLAVSHDGALFLWMEGNGNPMNIRFEPYGDRAVVTTHDEIASCAVSDPETDNLFFVAR